MTNESLTHIAIIPDGNRRWARKKKKLPWKGHEEGMKRFREIAQALYNYKIRYATFWGASERNLTKRSKTEVKVLTNLFRKGFHKELAERNFVKNKIRFRVIGKWNEILKDKKMAEAVRKLESETKQFKDHHLTILLGYNGTTEMLEALKRLRRLGMPTTATNLKESLWTGELPPVDLVIRTGGEPHWSAGFMMWLTADSQLYFTETLWPDFTKEKLREAIKEYSRRERRFGK